MVTAKIGSTFNEHGVCIDSEDQVFYEKDGIQVLGDFGTKDGKFCWGYRIQIHMPNIGSGCGGGASFTRPEDSFDTIEDAEASFKSFATEYISNQMKHSKDREDERQNLPAMQKALDELNQLTLF